jgi:hypothetical protein
MSLCETGATSRFVAVVAPRRPHALCMMADIKGQQRLPFGRRRCRYTAEFVGLDCTCHVLSGAAEIDWLEVI